MIFRFWVMMKILQVRLCKILWKSSITVSKSTQNLWFVSKLQNLSIRSLFKVFESIWLMSCWIKLSFLLKNVLVLQNDKMIRTLWLLWFRSIWPVKRTCMHNYTHMWLIYIHSWGNWVCFLSFDSIAIIVLKLWYDRRTLSKIIFKTEHLANLLWIVWYDYM